MPIRNGVTKVTPFLYYYNIDIKNDNVYNIVIGDWYRGKKLKLLKSIISTWVELLGIYTLIMLIWQFIELLFNVSITPNKINMQKVNNMERLKTIVFELENLVCLYCDADSSNCLSCISRKRVIEILEKNNINTKEEVK